MRILVIGGGGREHAVIQKLKENPKIEKIYCAPGNGGIAAIAECIPLKATDIQGVVGFSVQNKIELVVVTPDDPLALGMVDALENVGIKAFGPCARAAIIESSKVFSKELMHKYHIPTAKHIVFRKMEDAIAHIDSVNTFPVVIKAEGLALGKGVVIAQNKDQAADTVRSMMEEKVFGDAGNRIVIEEFLTGPEVSVLAFTDGKTLIPMVSAQDHKRAFDGDKGPNTGGMGAFSPSPHYTPAVAELCMQKIFLPTVEAMQKEDRVFKGVLYFGLMLTPEGPKVIEYNARFGDPETQVVLPRLKTDLLEIFEAVIHGRLGEIDIQWSDEHALCVVMASGGYPAKYQTGFEITGIENAMKDARTQVYQAGTAFKDGRYVTNGGRVLCVTALGEDLAQARNRAYRGVECIHFEKAHYRKDIGR
jgi:phosphoribosylamine--glycine ligase